MTSPGGRRQTLQTLKACRLIHPDSALIPPMTGLQGKPQGLTAHIDEGLAAIRPWWEWLESQPDPL